MKVIALMLSLVATSPAFARTVILCRGAGQEAVITLEDRKAFGRTLDCVSGPFVADMTPCAPNGEFGLSAPTGSASLVKVVKRWQEYGDHLGGVAGHFATKDKLNFNGGFNSPDGGFKEQWSIDVNRLTGVAVLKQEGKQDIKMACGKAEARF